MTPADDSVRLRAEVPAPVRFAALALVVEAAGLAVLAAVDLVKVLTGSPRSTLYAVVAAALVLATAAVLLLLARALRRLRSWAYSPTVVLQLLGLPVGYSLAVQAGLWQYGGPVLVLAIAVLVALFAPASRRSLGHG